MTSTLFSDARCPRLFALAPGVDYPAQLVEGVMARSHGQPPQALASVEILVNTRRMQRRLRSLFSASGARLLPRIRLLTDPLLLPGSSAGIPPIPPLRRRLEIAQLVDKLLQTDPTLAPRSALYDLSDSLARLFAEMQSEGVGFDALSGLDIGADPAHWQRSLHFLQLLETVIARDAPDPEGYQRARAEAAIERWQSDAPSHPILIAGSTGSRGTTALLMQAVARLPQGAVVLPGFDFDMPQPVWEALNDASTGEDHPQFRFRRLMDALDCSPHDIHPWTDQPAPSPARNRLVSLGLRPAPVTDQWMSEGRGLSDLDTALRDVTLIEAQSPRAEVQAIALRLRQAVETGTRAALITPDRTLARRVAASLDGWGIVADDSAGRPLSLSAPGRFLRMVAECLDGPISAKALIALLKHPLTHSGVDRASHLLHSRNLELALRRHALAFPDIGFLRAWADKAGCGDWAEWLSVLWDVAASDSARPLSDCVRSHLALAEALARGGGADGSGALWQEKAGVEARRTMNELAAEAGHGGDFTPTDYTDFVASLLQGREVRDPVTAHPDVMIWGTLEARVQGAELVILAGLNEGVWPAAPAPDPWLNRRMRAQAGLLLPERQIGLSAHDFQQAIAAPQVVLSRAIRDGEAQTVPARWLNRLVNLLSGLPAQGGDAALNGARARGRHLLDTARLFEADFRNIPDPTRQPAPRPAPCPPVAARPSELPVTAIKTLIRDPYAVYARYVLGLRKLNPLNPAPDALLRGTVLHRVFEHFARQAPEPDPRAQLLRLTETTLTEQVPWAAARVLWSARMARVADAFVLFHASQPGQIALLEEQGRIVLTDLGFTLTAKPDRVDAWPDGRLHIIDYKTGKPPSRDEQRYFDKQLMLEAVIARDGGFAQLGPCEVARISYFGLGNPPKVEATDVTPEVIEQTRAEFEALMGHFMSVGQGYAARRMVKTVSDQGDYDHLARYGEWVQEDVPVTFLVGDGA